MGRITHEPELKTLTSGTISVSTGMAINRNWTDKETGDRREEVCFVDLQAFGRNAEIIHQYFTTGMPIHVEGRLRYRAWETTNGEKRSKHDVLVDTFLKAGEIAIELRKKGLIKEIKSLALNIDLN